MKLGRGHCGWRKGWTLRLGFSRMPSASVFIFALDRRPVHQHIGNLSVGQRRIVIASVWSYKCPGLTLMGSHCRNRDTVGIAR
jgi:hypothetical protein